MARHLVITKDGNIEFDGEVGKYSWTEHPNGAIELRAEPVREPGAPGRGAAGFLEQLSGRTRSE